MSVGVGASHRADCGSCRCPALECEPGDILRYDPDAGE
ncbi:hypothetical protein BBJK_00616 [Bifidobacterium bifidum LMG 13195]|uniref:Uncharacterized protein n=1 Tax=Bifidobacterium bifidum LMG 13195 TaxID=1207542 RepID=A0A286TAK8_BIFBI|nr:hypothetical protein BBJK_00616 [Bifidobacterium bifidum LMG 13195]